MKWRQYRTILRSIKRRPEEWEIKDAESFSARFVDRYVTHLPSGLVLGLKFSGYAIVIDRREEFTSEQSSRVGDAIIDLIRANAANARPPIDFTKFNPNQEPQP